MRWQLAIVAVLVAGGAAWFVFQPRSEAPDLLVARDRLVGGPAVVASFSPGGAEGYRFTSIRGVGWVWVRTSGSDGTPLPDAIIFNGSQHLLRIADGCFIELGPVREPLVPGLTVAPKLTTMPALDERPGGEYAYSVDTRDFARAGAPAGAIRVVETLGALREGGSMSASTGDPPGVVWPGNYVIDEATGPELESTLALIRGAKASDYAELLIHERVIGTIVLSNAVLGPYRIVIPEACPERPTLLSSGVSGGQVESLRTSASPIRFGPGTPAVILNAKETLLRVRAPVEAFNAQIPGGGYGDLPVTSALVMIVADINGGHLGIEVVGCVGRPWFVC